MDIRRLLERFGGHLVLLLLALILIAAARTGALSDAIGAVAPAGLGTEPLAEAEAPLVPVARPTTLAETVIDLNTLPLLTDNSLVPNLNPITYQGQLPAHTNMITYTVQRNDTPNAIAESFGIEPETLLGCNPQLSEESSLLQVDDVLVICPENGVLHDVRQNDTLEGLSDRYGIPVADIINYEPNNLAFPFRLYPGSQLFIPGAVAEVFVWTAPSAPSGGGSSGSGGGYPNLGTGTYIWPVSGRRITQYYWYGHQAIDIGIPEGTAAYASDTGTVSYAAWNDSGYGYLIVINHGNGVETYYAHLSGFNVVPGQVVYQGNLIGLTGNTGRSSGPHIHFEIRRNGFERLNPLWAGYLP